MPYKLKDLQIEECNRWRDQGFRANLQCDHEEGCSARSPKSKTTWRFWRLAEFARDAAVAVGWECYDAIGKDYCPLHTTVALTRQADYDEEERHG